MAPNEPHVYDRSRPLPSFQPLYQYDLVNSPTPQTIAAVRITLPPNAAFPPHRHGSASVVGHVLSGAIWNRMNDEPVQELRAGATWYEAPGCHHRVFENYYCGADSETTVVLATYVVGTEVVREGGLEGLVIVDEEFKDVV